MRLKTDQVMDALATILATSATNLMNTDELLQVLLKDETLFFVK